MPETETIQLMHGVGARRFTPLPPDQHQWQRAAGEPMRHQLWSYLVEHSFGSKVGEGSPYAIAIDKDQSEIELHLEDAAKALGWDEANARRTWREGVQRGLWRNGARPGSGECWKGTKFKVPEGRRKMILCGKVVPRAADESTDDEPEKVCTDLLPDHILNEIKDRLPPYGFDAFAKLEPEAQVRFAYSYLPVDRAERAGIAEAVAGVRGIFAPQKDTIFTEFGIKKIHATRNGNGKVAASEPAGTGEGTTELRPIAAACQQAIQPLIERFVQTFRDSVQSAGTGMYTSGSEVSTGPASLLDETPPTQPLDSVLTSSLKRAGESVKTPPVDGQSALKQQHAGPEPEPDKETTVNRQLCDSPAGQAALNLFFVKVPEMQDVYPHTRFGDPLVTPRSKADVVLARRVLSALGDAGDMEGFLFQVAIELRTVPNSLGMLPRTRTRTPAQNPHDRYLGLILEWAGDYAAAAPKREKERQERAGRQSEIEAREKARQEEEAAETAAAERLEMEWRDLPPGEKQNLIALARAALKAEPRWRNISSVMRESESELYAKRLLRQRLERTERTE